VPNEMSVRMMYKCAGRVWAALSWTQSARLRVTGVVRAEVTQPQMQKALSDEIDAVFRKRPLPLCVGHVGEQRQL